MQMNGKEITLWFDRIHKFSQSDIWLEIQTDNMVWHTRIWRNMEFLFAVNSRNCLRAYMLTGYQILQGLFYCLKKFIPDLMVIYIFCTRLIKQSNFPFLYIYPYF